eukprot:CAMPEP_0195259644 /NCGR_PEP_ID=MMETSP0706-20130129/8088_1 /TAXON_ID=33640 /ORGANISM="Asterionellopsis glacialis, Strain CCMP134" /LENGTH=113 /DNA_ID=CAMNT_0040313185 /DNA_START=182 /DNA_END=520 /DNA_ORIENTATION=+
MDYRLFMTATPRNPDSQDKAADQEDIGSSENISVSSVNDVDVDGSALQVREVERKFKNEALFGPTIVEITYKDSEEKGITVPIKLLVISHKEVCKMMQNDGIEVDNTRRQDRE